MAAKEGSFIFKLKHETEKARNGRDFKLWKFLSSDISSKTTPPEPLQSFISWRMVFKHLSLCGAFLFQTTITCMIIITLIINLIIF